MIDKPEKAWNEVVKYFKYCDAGGKKVKTKSPQYDGNIGKNFKEKLVLKPIVKFQTIAGKVEVYDDELIKSFNNDFLYFYLICHAVQNGWENFPEFLVYKLIGHVHQARWITCASNTLRLFCQTKRPSKWLKKAVAFILNVYAPTLLAVKNDPNVVNEM